VVTTPEETQEQTKLRETWERAQDALSVVVTGEPGGRVRDNLLFLVVGLSLVGATYNVAFMALGILALVLLALRVRG
jgi:hypothetical protein